MSGLYIRGTGVLTSSQSCPPQQARPSHHGRFARYSHRGQDLVEMESFDWPSRRILPYTGVSSFYVYMVPVRFSGFHEMVCFDWLSRMILPYTGVSTLYANKYGVLRLAWYTKSQNLFGQPSIAVAATMWQNIAQLLHPLATMAKKRRSESHQAEDEASVQSNEMSDSQSEQQSEEEASDADQQGQASLDEEEEELEASDDEEDVRKRKVHKLSMRQTEDFNAKLNKRGVVYIARIPPRMTPTKLKSLLADYGISRVYLVEEDASKRKRRRKLTGNASKRYTEGWIEFESKRIAKHVALNFNNTPMSNHKRNHHYDDLWNLKYLSKFKWSHLTEKVAYERRVREQKLRLETMQAKRETAAYRQLVETGKKIDKIEARKRRRADRRGEKYEPRRPKRDERQVQPIGEAGDKKSSKRALLGSLV